MKIYHFPENDRRPFEVKCSLCYGSRFSNESFNSDLISEKLGLTPTKAWRKGDTRKPFTPHGKPSKFEFDFWWYSTDKVRTGEPEEVLWKLLDTILPLKEELKSVSNEIQLGGVITVVIDCIEEVQPGFHLSAEILNKISELNMEIGFDIYPFSEG